MAKTFYVVRHAKSSWADLGVSDHQRKLNGRGKRDGPIMAREVANAEVKPSVILSSDAKRAWQTAKYFAKALFSNHDVIQAVSSIYHCGANHFIDLINEQNDDHSCVILFGHNPGITYLANEVSDEPIDNVPTCGVLFIVSSADKWEDVSFSNCKLNKFIYPKMFV